MTEFSDREAHDVIQVIRPFVEQMLDQEWVDGPDFHLMISRRLPNGGYEVIAEEYFGDAQKCMLVYRPNAQAKTVITARTGLSSREVQLMRPELLEYGDGIYWGSVIQGDVIVAGSGVQPWFDEVIAKATLALCMALIQQAFEVSREHAENANNTRY